MQPAYNPAMSGGEKVNYGEAPPPYPGTSPAPPPAYPPNTSTPMAAAYPPNTGAPMAAAYPPNTGTPMAAAYPPPNTAFVTGGTTVVQPIGTTVLMTGNCPRCHVGNLIEESNTGALVCIVILVILFFPIGLLYLLCLPGATERRCPHCGYHSD